MPKRWLLDHNVPIQLVRWLSERGIQAEAVASLGWQELPDSELVIVAAKEFDVLLTRDLDFGEAAGPTLENSDLAVILLSIRQARAAQFLEALSEAWGDGEPEIKPGQVILWPRRQ